MELWTYEQESWAQGCEMVCGVDEAGAGPLMGPVYAAAVILPRECVIEGLNDSKKLSERTREMHGRWPASALRRSMPQIFSPPV